MKTKQFFPIFLAIAVLISLNSASAELGCCTNPGAPNSIACSPDQLVLDSECCPQLDTNPQYYNFPNGPTTKDECVNNFFKAKQDCSGFTECTGVGCCCSALGGSIKPALQCKGSGQVFYGNINDLNKCTQQCAMPQCGDGIDNDKNGCADSQDTSCTNPSVKVEAGGTCKSIGNCNDASYAPKLTNLLISPSKGQKKLSLRWQDECSQNAKSYDVLRCKGNGCTNFAVISSTITNSFEDATEDLLFDTVYTYQIKAHYSPQSATPAITKTADMGNLECYGQTTNTNFCVQPSYYAQYKNYLLANFPSEFSGDFGQKVSNKFQGRFNKAFSCDDANKLIGKGPQPACTSEQFCRITNNQPICKDKEDCTQDSENLFGLFSSKNKCENKINLLGISESRNCFYDRSHTIVNACYNCDPTMACYDYKTEDACGTDNCGAGRCKWKNLVGSFGIGACVSTKEYNCQWCDKKGTETLENLRSYNEVFDLCTKTKSDILSEGNFKCYFKNKKSANCENIVCSDYDGSQCASKIDLNENNQIVNPSQDVCGIKACQNFGTGCAKNSDGDNIQDCEARDCEIDYFPPDATITSSRNPKGIYDSLSIKIYDKSSADKSPSLVAGPDYSTFLCMEPCGADGHPYDASTAARSIILSNLNAFDGTKGNRLLSLKEGANTIRYYSQDPSKNVGEVKKITIEAYSNTAGPKVFSVSIKGSQKILDKMHTSTKTPLIDVTFFEPAIITSARLSAQSSSKVLELQPNTASSRIVSLQVPENLPDGEYKLEINARNDKNIIMDALYYQAIVVDTAAPTVIILPADKSVIESSSNVQVKLTFSEEVSLTSASMDSDSILKTLVTADNKVFAATPALTDGSKTLSVGASDYAGNQVSSASKFIIDVNPLSIKLVRPANGAATANIFDVVAETDNDAECKYSVDNDFNYDVMIKFTSTGSTQHTIANFNKIAAGDSTVHRLFVKCKDRRGIVAKTFELSVDASKPVIKSAVAFPNPIAEEPFTTTLSVEADKPVLCKFSTSSRTFDTMEGKFDGFDQNNFNLINKKSVTLAGAASYFVACQGKSGLVSDTSEIKISVDAGAPLRIVSHTPALFKTTSVALSFETNKRSVCTFADNPNLQLGTVVGPADYNHRKEITLNTGSYTFTVECRNPAGDSARATISFVVDTTPPAMLFVDDTSTLTLTPDKTCNTDKLRVKFNGEDAESGVSKYFYSLLQGTQTVKNFVEALPDAANQWFWVENLNLEDNKKYAFSVKAKNFAGLESALKQSDGITVDINSCTIGCGNKIIDPKEDCDGTNMGPANGQCSQYSTAFISGELKCNTPGTSNQCKFDTAGCIGVPGVCGDGVLNAKETCDGNSFGIIKNCKDYKDFKSGVLKCNPAGTANQCELDTSSCIPVDPCGNSKLDAGELCDPDDGTFIYGPVSRCTSYSNFIAGTLGCTRDCNLDTTNCVGSKYCGDNVLQSGEHCDRNLFGAAKLCTDLGFISGDLRCLQNCYLDTTGCRPRPNCGNGIIDTGEECDSSNLGLQSTSCSDFYPNIFTGGTLRCGSNCKLDTGSCAGVPGTCDGKFINPNEACDGSFFGVIDNCADLGFLSGAITCKNCNLDTTKCIPKPNCLNGLIDPGEECDGSNFGLLTTRCVDYSTYFQSGAISCSSECKLDTNNCRPAPLCGNGFRDPGEQCDGSNLDGLSGTCANFSNSFISGSIRCDSSCQIITSGCLRVSPRCGNNFIDIGLGETCDGNNFGIFGGGCANYSSNFIGGSLSCTNCRINTTQCQPPQPTPKCNDGSVNQLGEECDTSDFDGKSCSTFGYLSGALKCTDLCKLDKADCTSPGLRICGDGAVDKPNSGNINEQCDINKLNGNINLDGKSCSSFSAYTSGTLGCRNDCVFDYSRCSGSGNTTPTCQDGTVNQVIEECDKTDLRGKTCQSLGWASGELKCTGSCALDTSSCSNPLPRYCGDSTAQKPNSAGFNEECDKTDLDNKRCVSFPAYKDGQLSCRNDCIFNYAACTLNTTIPRCGDGKISTGELCDSSNLDNKKCSDFGRPGGTLACDGDCQFNLTQCSQPPPCGNANIDTGELCDDNGPVFGSVNSCGFYTNFIGGTLGCSNCKLDTTNCIKPAFCGDKIINTGEQCDTNTFGSVSSCTDLGFASGSLGCGANCFMDTSKCVPRPKCGNGIIDPTEECDGNNTGPLNEQCSQYSPQTFTGGVLKCKSDCKLDTSACNGIVGICGNSLVNIGESCDGTTFGSIKDCKDYNDFSGGLIKCASNCKLDTSLCVPIDKCGNTIIDPSESCDGNYFGALNTSCAAYAPVFKRGDIKCASCKLDTSSCEEKPKCGNGFIDQDELCDGNLFFNLTDLSCTAWGANFISGNLSCSSSCKVSTRNCNTNSTVVTPRPCKDRGDCDINSTCSDNSDCTSRYCYLGKCKEPTCGDGVKNQNEPDIDCGGPCSAKCQNDKKCFQGTDCASFSCSLGTCKPQDSCSDGKFSLGESDVDCGGSCPSKCGSGKSCSRNTDCNNGLQCASSICVNPGNNGTAQCSVDGQADTDCDGLPDSWEISHGMNPNDPSDAVNDLDNDGLTNIQEYQVKTSVFGESTDPNKIDTDGDGFTDKQEIDAGTNPLDAKDFPKSNKLKIMLFVFGIIILLGGFGYLGYRVVSQRKEEEFGFSKPSATSRAPVQAPRQVQFGQKPLAGRMPIPLQKRVMEKGAGRKKLFESFGSQEKPKPKEEIKPAKSEKPEVKILAQKKQHQESKKKPRAKKPKGDVFVRLKEIASDSKKKKSIKSKK